MGSKLVRATLYSIEKKHHACHHALQRIEMASTDQYLEHNYMREQNPV